MDASDTYQLIILIILLALSAFFSSNETALMAGGLLQVSKAVYEGSMAGINAGKYVRQRKKAAD